MTARRRPTGGRSIRPPASVALVIAVLAPLLTSASARATATFGKTSIGASSDRFLGGRKRVNRYSLPVAGSVTKLSIYLGPAAKSGEQVMEGIVYADASGKPQALLAVSQPLTYSSSSSAGWFDLNFAAPVNLSAGNYWIGVITGATSNVASFRYDSVASSRDYNANTYASGPSDPFGTASVDSKQTSLYATYTPSSPIPVPTNTAPPTISGTAKQGQTLTEAHGSWTNSPTGFSYQWLQCDSLGNACLPIAGATVQTYVPVAADVEHTLKVQEIASNEAGASAPATSSATAVVQASTARFGKTSVGASADSFAADRKRVSRYSLLASGSLTKLSIYLAPTATSGQQVLKGIVYGDAAGKPGSLIATTAAIRLPGLPAASP